MRVELNAQKKQQKDDSNMGKICNQVRILDESYTPRTYKKTKNDLGTEQGLPGKEPNSCQNSRTRKNQENGEKNRVI